MHEDQLYFDGLLVQASILNLGRRIYSFEARNAFNRFLEKLIDEEVVPPLVFAPLNNKFHFTLDPCSTHENALCARHFTKTEDGLTQNWGNHVAFMNPPGGADIGAWMHKAFESAILGATVVCFVPNRPDLDWWSQYALRGEVRSLCSPLEPNGGKFGPSRVLVGFRPNQTAHQDSLFGFLEMDD